MVLIFAKKCKLVVEILQIIRHLCLSRTCPLITKTKLIPYENLALYKELRFSIYCSIKFLNFLIIVTYLNPIVHLLEYNNLLSDIRMW